MAKKVVSLACAFFSEKNRSDECSHPINMDYFKHFSELMYLFQGHTPTFLDYIIFHDGNPHLKQPLFHS